MAYTLHGHHITGTRTDSLQRSVARCGGPGLCGDCSKQAASCLITIANNHGIEDASVDFSKHNENTLYRVNDALHASGLNENQVRDAITAMQNAGILFRERI